MAKSARKFSDQTDAIAESLTQLFVGSVRKGIEMGLQAAVENTKQDSSNAAVHWMLGIEGKGNVYGRKFGKLQDLRGGKHPLVGRKGEKRGSNSAVTEEVLRRERETVLGKYVKGQRPETGFYFYNAVAGDAKYAYHANIAEAGKMAVAAAVTHFNREIAQGNTRRFRRKG